MTVDPLVLVVEVDRATDRLLRTADALDEAAVRAPSLLPDWSRGHVLTHLARNADAMVNLLTATRTGEHIPAYASEEAREADIVAGAGRTPGELLADLRAAAARLTDAIEAMPPEAWSATVAGRQGPQPAATLPWARLREVEVHHVDLDAGYTPADWPEAFAQHLLHEVTTNLGRRSGVPAVVLCPSGGHELPLGESEGAPKVSGPAYALAAWLTGRSMGDGLTVGRGDTLPILPNWI